MEFGYLVDEELATTIGDRGNICPLMDRDFARVGPDSREGHARVHVPGLQDTPLKLVALCQSATANLRDLLKERAPTTGVF